MPDAPNPGIRYLEEVTKELSRQRRYLWFQGPDDKYPEGSFIVYQELTPRDSDYDPWANARLISQAPTLLEAVEKARAVREDGD